MVHEMAGPKKEQKAEVIAAIREHLMLEGPANWDATMARFPDVSRSTFFRYIKEVRESIEGAAAEDSPGALKLAQKTIRTRVESTAKTQERIREHLPVAPSPAVVAAAPQDALKAFNFFAFFDQIVRDVELSRGSAVTVNPDGTEKVKNPVLLDRNLARRLSIIETYLHSIETVYNMERIRELYDLIIEEVGKASPDLQQAVLVRLRELNNRRGITMAANVR